MEQTHSSTSGMRAKIHQQNQKLRQHAVEPSDLPLRARRDLIAHNVAVSQPVGVSGDLEMLTPKVHGGGSGGGRTTPDGIVRGPHVRNDAKGMRVGVDEFVWGRNNFLRCHGWDGGRLDACDRGRDAELALPLGQLL